MSGLPIPARPDELPPVLPRQTFPRWPALLAWLVIVGCLVFINYRNAHSARLAEDKVMVDEMQLKLQAEMILGSRSLVKPTDQKLFDTMEADAKTPEDRVRVAIIAGEVQGKDQALQRLAALANAQPRPELAADLAALRTIYTSANGAAALDPAARDLLIQHYDYFANVALVYGTADDTAPRETLKAAAERIFIRLGLVTAGILLLVFAGIGLFITAIVFELQGKYRRAYVADPLVNTAFLEGFAIYLVLYLAAGSVIRALGSTSPAWYLPVLLLIPLVMHWTARRGANADEQRRAFGWHRGRGVLREMGAGILGYIAGLPVMILGIVITLWLIRVTHIEPRPNPVEEMLQGSVWKVLTMYVLACGFAPVMEETMFRGALFHHLRRRWGWMISASVVAVIFGSVHPYGLVVVPTLGSIALVLAGLREWRGSIIASMTAHSLHNFLATTIALLLLR